MRPNSVFSVAYRRNLAIGLDQLVNAVMKGDPDETVSDRLRRVRAAHGGKIPASRPWLRFLGWFLDGVAPGHLEKPIVETDEGRDGLVDLPGEE